MAPGAVTLPRWAKTFSKRRGPDRRGDVERKRTRTCPKCTKTAQRGWAKGFCFACARMQGLQDPRRNHDTGSLSKKKMKQKLKLKSTRKQKKPKKVVTKDSKKKGKLNQYLKLTKQEKVALELISARRQKKLTKTEKNLTQAEVEAKNLEIKLLKPVAGLAKAAMDSDSEAEFFQAPAGDIRRLAPR